MSFTFSKTNMYDHRQIQQAKGRAKDEQAALDKVYACAKERGWEVFTVYTSRGMDGTVEYSALFRIPHEQG